MHPGHSCRGVSARAPGLASGDVAAGGGADVGTCVGIVDSLLDAAGTRCGDAIGRGTLGCIVAMARTHAAFAGARALRPAMRLPRALFAVKLSD